MDDARKALLKTFYGGNFENELPCMLKLKHEVIQAATNIVKHPKYSNILEYCSKEGNKRNPIFSALSYILYEVEDASLTEVLDDLYRQA